MDLKPTVLLGASTIQTKEKIKERSFINSPCEADSQISLSQSHTFIHLTTVWKVLWKTLLVPLLSILQDLAMLIEQFWQAEDRSQQQTETHWWSSTECFIAEGFALQSWSCHTHSAHLSGTKPRCLMEPPPQPHLAIYQRSALAIYQHKCKGKNANWEFSINMHIVLVHGHLMPTDRYFRRYCYQETSFQSMLVTTLGSNIYLIYIGAIFI